MHPAVKVAALACLLAAIAPAQTTQALISGRLVDSLTGRPIAHAYVIYEALNANTSGAAESDEAGYYYLPLLSPNLYRVRFTAPGYQAQELQEIELPVAARFELDLRMRPLSDVWEAGQFRSVFLPGAKTIVTFYGPDVDTSRSGSFEAQQGRRAPLESTISQVIDSNELLDLPLQGRDVYDMLVTQQGVTADQATGRGLGLSINGQRPTSSNFLLDGLENNNYLITGPLVGLAPELIQEYRVSINNFSAEYGRTAGFVANAITYSGSGAFHGTAYFYLRNEVLNANDFQRNRLGRQRVPLKEIQPGFRVGGPLFGKRLDNRLVFSVAFENLRARSRPDAILYSFPTTAYIQNLPASSLARQLLTTYAPPPVSSTTRNFATFSIRPTSTIDRPTALTRFDYKTTRDQYSLRASAVLLSKPDFAFSPYKDFISALHQNTLAFSANNLHTFSPGLANEARAGYSTDDLSFDRKNPQIPSLVSSDTVSLPGAAFLFPVSKPQRHVAVSGQCDPQPRTSPDHGRSGTVAAQLSRHPRARTRRPVLFHQPGHFCAGSADDLPGTGQTRDSARHIDPQLSPRISLHPILLLFSGHLQAGAALHAELWIALRELRIAFERRGGQRCADPARHRHWIPAVALYRQPGLPRARRPEALSDGSQELRATRRLLLGPLRARPHHCARGVRHFLRPAVRQPVADRAREQPHVLSVPSHRCVVQLSGSGCERIAGPRQRLRAHRATQPDDDPAGSQKRPYRQLFSGSATSAHQKPRARSKRADHARPPPDHHRRDQSLRRSGHAAHHARCARPT
jgi:hypothetical protein